MSNYFKKGFTLIELLLVIAIIGLLVSIVLISLQGAAASARDAKRDSESDTLRKTLEVYHGNHGKYPSSPDSESEEGCCLEDNPTIKNEILPYISSIPQDPSYDPGEADNLDKHCYRYKTIDDGAEYKIRVNYEGTEPKEIASWGGGGIAFGPTGIAISGCSTLDQAGETYLLTADILNHGTDSCMNITADNVTLNCQGHTIGGNDSAKYGIDIYRGSLATTSATIQNCVVSDWYMTNIRVWNAKGNTFTNVDSNSSQVYGYWFWTSNGNILENCTAEQNDVHGFYFYNSQYSILTDCAASFNGTNLGNSGLNLQDNNYMTINGFVGNNNRNGIYATASDHNNFNDVTVNSNDDDGFHCQIWESTFSNITANFNGARGIFVDNGDGNDFSNITTNSNTQYGIRLAIADDNTITNATSTLNDFGIRVDYSDNNTFTNVNLSSNNTGIRIYEDAVGNTITGSNISSNVQNGIMLDHYTYDGVISDSIIANNGEAGLYILGAFSPSNNTIYNNLFNNSGTYGNIRLAPSVTLTNHFNTAKQAGTRIYSDGDQIGGNYYTNNTATGHSDNCIDLAKDGFCDDPYEHATNNVDAFPLSNKFE